MLALKESIVQTALDQTAETFGSKRKTFQGEVLRAVSEHRDSLWKEQLPTINWELFDRGTEAYTWAALEEFATQAKSKGLLDAAPHGAEFRKFARPP